MIACPSRPNLRHRQARILRPAAWAVGLAAIALLQAPAAFAAGVATYLTGIGVDVTSANITSPDRPASAWTPSASGVAYQIEDSVAANGYVGPGYGGQPYDLEALYLQVTGNTLYITGITGNTSVVGSVMPGAAGSTCTGDCRTFGLGDFFIGTGGGTSFKPIAAIETTGRYITMDGSGYSTGWSSPLVQGAIVAVSGTVGTTTVAPVNNGWDVGLANWGANYKPGAPTQLNAAAGTGYVNTGLVADFRFEVIGAHAAYQAIVDLPSFASAISGGLPNPFTVHWGEICGNDFLQWDPAIGAGSPLPVPLPPSLALLAIGALGMAPTLRRRARRPIA